MLLFCLDCLLVFVSLPKWSFVSLNQGLDDKVIVFKYKKKKNYRRNIGHRQVFFGLSRSLLTTIVLPHKFAVCWD